MLKIIANINKELPNSFRVLYLNKIKSVRIEKKVKNVLQNLIDYIVDDNPDKQGKYTPGDHIVVKPTDYIYEKKPDYLISTRNYRLLSSIYII